MPSSITTLHIAENLQPPELWLADTEGNLTAILLNEPDVVSSFLRNRTILSPVAPYAAGSLQPRSRINAIQVAVDENGEKRAYTADRNGGVWRWKITAEDNRLQRLEQDVRIAQHHGIASDLTLFYHGDIRWVASVGTDDVALITPDAIAPLLDIARRTIRDSTSGPPL